MSYGAFCTVHRFGAFGERQPRKRGEIIVRDDSGGKEYRFEIPYVRGELRKFTAWLEDSLFRHDRVKITGSYPYYDVEYVH